MALINTNATIAVLGDVEIIKSKAGKEWPKQMVVISTEGGKEPFDKIALTAFGDMVEEVAKFSKGAKVKVTYSVSAREFNGKWFNDVSLYRIENQGAAPVAPASQEPNEQSEDLPF